MFQSKFLLNKLSEKLLLNQLFIQETKLLMLKECHLELLKLLQLLNQLKQELKPEEESLMLQLNKFIIILQLYQLFMKEKKLLTLLKEPTNKCQWKLKPENQLWEEEIELKYSKLKLTKFIIILLLNQQFILKLLKLDLIDYQIKLETMKILFIQPKLKLLKEKKLLLFQPNKLLPNQFINILLKKWKSIIFTDQLLKRNIL